MLYNIVYSSHTLIFIISLSHECKLHEEKNFLCVLYTTLFLVPRIVPSTEYLHSELTVTE